MNICFTFQLTKNFKTRNGTGFGRLSWNGTAEHGTVNRNGTDREGNGHISTPMGSQKLMTSAN